MLPLIFCVIPLNIGRLNPNNIKTPITKQTVDVALSDLTNNHIAIIKTIAWNILFLFLRKPFFLTPSKKKCQKKNIQ